MIGCVGFADCPCDRCRATRVAVTECHPDHEACYHSYCGVCRTEDTLAHYAHC